MRKKIPKIITIFFITIFVLQIAALVFLLLIPDSISAAELQVEIGGQKSVSGIEDYIRLVYNYGTGVVGIVAAIVLMFGGLMWLTAGGSQERVTAAREWIKAALTGLIIALLSFIILLTINPDLVQLKPLKIEKIESVSNAISNQGQEELNIKITLCEKDSDCRSGERCVTVGSRKICSGGGFLHACANDSDCRSQFRCLDNECLGGTRCASDRDCPAGEVCSSFYYDKLGYNVCLNP